MGLVRGADDGDQDPVVDAAGAPQPLWMGPCADCGVFITVLGGADGAEHRCARCGAREAPGRDA